MLSEKIVTLLLLLLISIFTTLSFHNKSCQKSIYLSHEESLTLTLAQQAIKTLKRVDINNASRYTLTKLPGIGPKSAERIIAYRSSHNGFASKEELLNIKGIGAKKYGAIKDRVEVDVPE